MVLEEFSRTEALLGEGATKKLAAARVLIFGVGGVGGHAFEALVRSGVGAIDVVDSDDVAKSNINRQTLALHSTVGRSKVEVARERGLDINPDCKIGVYKTFFLPEEADKFDFASYDYVIDAIDTVAGKLGIILAAEAAGVPVISSMGAGNKLDPTRFEVSDIYKTSVCPLAAALRRLCRKNGVKPFKVVYSKEDPVRRPTSDGERLPPASCAFVPSVAGLIIAGEVIKDILKK